MTRASRPTILLLGGTSETAPLATGLAELGCQVLVSTATDEPLRVGDHQAIRRRCGRLGPAGMVALLNERDIFALVDATHPYASLAHRTAREACEKAGCFYLRYQRAATQGPGEGWIYADNHDHAARLACGPGGPVLLTIGSRHLLPYVKEAGRQQVPLYARVLDHPESVGACDAAGLEPSGRIFGRGPFSCEDNVALIRRHRIAVIVTKESGRAGGVEEKWRAAQQEQCRFIVVKRPDEPRSRCFGSMEELLAELAAAMRA